MVQRAAPPITLCALSVFALGIGSGQQQPIQRVTTVGLNRESALIGCIAEGASRSISGQIAVSLTLEAVIRCIQPETGGSEDAGQLIRESFREANQAVYDYAHRMRAGAAIGASLLLWGIHHGKAVVGRSGRGEVFLLRSGTVTPLFEASPSAEGVLDRFVGANAKVLVDLATTALLEGDELLFLNGPPDSFGGKSAGLDNFRLLVSRIFSESQPAADRLATILSGLGEAHSGMIVGYGSPAIELREQISAPLAATQTAKGEE